MKQARFAAAPRFQARADAPVRAQRSALRLALFAAGFAVFAAGLALAAAGGVEGAAGPVLAAVPGTVAVAVLAAAAGALVASLAQALRGFSPLAGFAVAPIGLVSVYALLPVLGLLFTPGPFMAAVLIGFAVCAQAVLIDGRWPAPGFAGMAGLLPLTLMVTAGLGLSGLEAGLPEANLGRALLAEAGRPAAAAALLGAFAAALAIRLAASGTERGP